MLYFARKLCIILIVITTYMVLPKCQTLGARRNATDFNTAHARQIMRLAKSAEMSNYMNETVKPCDDFFRFACGNFHKTNPASSKTGVFHILAKAYNHKVEKLLSAGKRTNEHTMERKVKYFYESCLDRDSIRHNYREKLLSVVEEFGGMPALKGARWQPEKFDWLETVALILRKYGKQIIIGADISADLNNNAINRLYVGQLDELITSKADTYYLGISLLWSMQLTSLLGMNSTLARETAYNMAMFEQKLAKGMIDPREGLGMEDLTKLRMLDEMKQSYQPELDIQRYVRIWLGREYLLPVYEYVDGYLQNLQKLLQETPPDVVANYIIWQLLVSFQIEFGEQKQSKRRADCVLNTKKHFIKYLDNMVFRHIVETQNVNNIFDDVLTMWSELKQSFTQTLQSNASHWMSDMTRDKALEKLSAMTIEINSYANEDFDKEFGELVISTEDYFENMINILEINGRNYADKLLAPPKIDEATKLSFSPAYAPEINRVFIPVSFLQPRYFWDNAYPRALKYSTLGYIISHEIVHGFDDTLRKYDAQGNLNDWWDKNSTEAFVLRKECLREQYGQLKFSGSKLPKTNAQGENIADNAGIRIAYDAYMNWLRSNVALEAVLSEHEMLPQLNYTQTQLFFIGVAQVWCTDINLSYRDLMVTTDVHAPEEARVMGMLSNFDEFAKEFQCELGTKMNPTKKCIFY